MVVVVVVVVLVQTGLLPVVTVVTVVVVSEVLSPIINPPETDVISLGVSSRIESLSISNIVFPYCYLRQRENSGIDIVLQGLLDVLLCFSRFSL